MLNQPLFKLFLPTFFCTIFLISFYACSGEETEENISEETINEPGENAVEVDEGDIIINIEQNTVIKNSTIEVTLRNDANIDSIKLFFDENLLGSLSSPPYTFQFDPNSYSDGDYRLKVEVLSGNEVIASKILETKIDNTGPSLIIETLNEDQKICGEIELVPQITDEISEVSKVEVFLDEDTVEVFENTSDFSFILNQVNHESGNRKLKFVMEDTVGNVSKDSLNIVLSKEVVSLRFPDNFVRKGADKLHAILSKQDGEFLDVVTHSSGVAETLSLCAPANLDNNEEYILTFVEDFQSTIFHFYVYGNLTKTIVGEEIRLPQRSASLSIASVDLEFPENEPDFYLRSATPWSSMVFFDNKLSGYVSKTFTVDALGFDKAFVMNFNRDLGRSYQWAFIENIDERTSLLATDFSSANVKHDFLNVNGTSSSPFLSIYGFESEAHYRAMNGHMIYWNPLLNSLNSNDYSYADIFDYTLYSIKVDRYGVDGAGSPPESISVPSGSVFYSFLNNKIEFNGQSDFEIGRVRLENRENEPIVVEFIFDGQKSDVIIPQLPEGLFSQSVHEVFEMEKLEAVQGTAENYENISDYKEYISKILVPGVPFYLVAPKRERIFAQQGLLPIFEFPFYERL